MSLQYWMARYFFHDRVVRRLEKDQKSGMAVVLRSVEYMGQWKVVALLRLGPAPYNILSYALVSRHGAIMTHRDSSGLTVTHRALSAAAAQHM